MVPISSLIITHVTLILAITIVKALLFLLLVFAVMLVIPLYFLHFQLQLVLVSITFNPSALLFFLLRLFQKIKSPIGLSYIDVEIFSVLKVKTPPQKNL